MPLDEGQPGLLPVIVDAIGRHLSATRISTRIRDELPAQPISGRVLGIHRSALNLVFDGRLVTIALASQGGLPMGIAIDTQAPLDRLGIYPTMRFEASRDRVAIGDRLVISVAGAVPWSPRLPVFGSRSATDRRQRILQALEIAGAIAPPIGFGPLLRCLGRDRPAADPLGARAAAALGSMLRALERDEMGSAVRAAEALLGLGPGATPSGDDLLVGLLAGMAAAGHPGASGLARLISAQAPGRTTLLAEAFLRHAGDLEFSERVHRIAAALMDQGTDRLYDAVTAACAWGASSGTDLLLGMLIGITADQSTLSARLADVAGSMVAAA